MREVTTLEEGGSPPEAAVREPVWERILGGPADKLPGFSITFSLARILAFKGPLGVDEPPRSVVGEPWRVETGARAEGVQLRVTGDLSTVLEAAKTGMNVEAILDPASAALLRALSDPETIDRARELAKRAWRAASRELEGLYSKRDTAYLWVRAVNCPGCGLKVPIVDDPWVVEGEYLIHFDVPSSGAEVEPEPVKVGEVEPVQTLRDSGLVCPRCGRNVGEAELRSRLLVSQVTGGPDHRYMVAVVKEDGSVEPPSGDDLARVAEAEEELKRLADGVIVPYGEEPPGDAHAYGVPDVSVAFDPRQLLAHGILAKAVKGTGDAPSSSLIAAALALLSVRNSRLSPWNPARAEPDPAVGWTWKYGELNVVREWPRVWDTVASMVEELVEVVDRCRGGVEVRTSHRVGAWDPVHSLHRAWFRALRDTVPDRGHHDVPTHVEVSWEGGGWKVVPGDEIPHVWRELALMASDAWPVPGDDVVVVEEGSVRRVQADEVRKIVETRVLRMMKRTFDKLGGSEVKTLRTVPYAASLSVVKVGPSGGVSPPEDGPLIGWRVLIGYIVKSLGTPLTEPEARLYAAYRLIWGYPGPSELPDPAFVRDAAAGLGLDTGGVRFLRPDGGARTYESFEGKPVDVVDGFHAALKEGEPLEPGDERAYLALAVVRAAEIRGEDHPEVEAARRALGGW